MDLSPDLESPRLPGPGKFLKAIYALFEVACAALLGSIFAGAVVSLLGWNPAVDVLVDRDALITFLLLEGGFTLLLIFAFQGVRGWGLAELGGRGRGWGREALVGLLTVPGLFAVVVATSLLFQLTAPGWVSEFNPLLDLIKTPTDVAWFLATGILVGGVKEEIQRAFILDRFCRYLGGPVVGLVLWSAIFGLGHVSQGPDRAVQASLLGLLFGLIYLWRRSLVAPIVSHAVYDIVVVLLAYYVPDI